jgi:hypothetical protein
MVSTHVLPVGPIYRRDVESKSIECRVTLSSESASPLLRRNSILGKLMVTFYFLSSPPTYECVESERIINVFTIARHCFLSSAIWV